MSENEKAAYGQEPIRTDRLRAIGRDGFAFFPNRFLREGYFASLSSDELRLYVFLVLASNRAGVSHYHYDRICGILKIPLEDYLRARDQLIDRDLLAFDGSRFQVLALPSKAYMRPESTKSTNVDATSHIDGVGDIIDRDSGVDRCRAILKSLR